MINEVKIMDKLKKPQKFAVFGDSIGRGVIYDPESNGYETDKGFVSMLEAEWGIRSENFTRFGYTVDKGLEMLEKKAERVRGSDIVFLEFGGNDSDFDWKKIAADPDAHHLPKTLLSDFLVIYGRMIDRVRELGAKPVVLDLPPIESELYFRRVSDGVSGDNILKWLNGDKREIFRWHRTYSYAVTNLCKENGARMIDIRSAFDGRELSSYICVDGIHPSVDGHRLIFNKIISEFEA